MNTTNNPTTSTSISSLKGRAKSTYCRVLTAIAEDNTGSYMGHAFAALTENAKEIAIQSGRYMNTYIRGAQRATDAEAAAIELEAKAAAHVARKSMRNIDHVVASAFLAELIRREREEDAPKPTTDGTTTNNATEFSELTHAGQCLDIYLMNTESIYNAYTVPAINRVIKATGAGEYVSTDPYYAAKDIQEVSPAIQAAARLVRKYDHMTPTVADIEAVTARYVAYVIDCAKYELQNA